jgi:type I restriction enzyme S subunit
MSFPSYPRYKHSGVAWLGNVPKDWAVRKFRHLFRESAEKIDEDVVGPMLSVSGYRGIEVKEYDDENRRRSQEDLVGYRVVRVGQLVVNTMWLNYAGLGVSDYEGHVSPAYRSYQMSHDLNKRFIHHLLRSGIYVQGYTRLLTGIRPNSLQMSRDDLMEFPVLVPPISDQDDIAVFLDQETAKIDELVLEQQRLIDLLKEKRQAVITRAVTKGLDPDVSTKPSGIEWLGDVPAHWDVKPIRMIANVVRGASPRPAGDPKYFGGDFMPWVTVAEITKDDVVYLTETESFLTQEGSIHSNIFRSDTLIYSNSGATLGVPKILQIDACANDGVVAFLNLDGQVQTEFLYHYLASITDNIREKARQGSGQPNLNTDIVKDLRFGLPPMEEQEGIVSRISELVNEFGALTASAQQAIDLLQERRAVLISGAVTGQIDVRGLIESAAA